MISRYCFCLFVCFRNETISIKYSGYLLKRSNNPWKESKTVPTTANGASAGAGNTEKSTRYPWLAQHNAIRNQEGQSSGGTDCRQNDVAGAYVEGVAGIGERGVPMLLNVPSPLSPSRQKALPPLPMSTLLPPIPTLGDSQIFQQREEGRENEDAGVDNRSNQQQLQMQHQRAPRDINALIIPDLDVSSKTTLEIGGATGEAEDTIDETTKPEMTATVTAAAATTSIMPTNVLGENNDNEVKNKNDSSDDNSTYDYDTINVENAIEMAASFFGRDSSSCYKQSPLQQNGQKSQQQRGKIQQGQHCVEKEEQEEDISVEEEDDDEGISEEEDSEEEPAVDHYDHLNLTDHQLSTTSHHSFSTTSYTTNQNINASNHVGGGGGGGDDDDEINFPTAIDHLPSSSGESSHIPLIPRSRTQPIAIGPSKSEDSSDCYNYNYYHSSQNQYDSRQPLNLDSHLNFNLNYQNITGNSRDISVDSYNNNGNDDKNVLLSPMTYAGNSNIDSTTNAAATKIIKTMNRKKFCPPNSLPRPPAYVRMTSAPAAQRPAVEMKYPPPPPDYIDSKDGHIWRAKYCILEDGVLYFYPTAEIGNSPGARQERVKMASLDYGGYTNRNDILHNTDSVVTGTDTANVEDNNIKNGNSRNNRSNHLAAANMNINKTYESDHLAKSPMPRKSFGQQQWLVNSNEKNDRESFYQDPDVYWEKRVALNMVGNVRSNPDYGERVFELLAISSDEDKDKVGGVDTLLLRAANEHEMNCWIFEIHRSFIFLMKQIAEIVGSFRSSTEDRKMKSSRHIQARQHSSPLTPVIGQSNLSEPNPKTVTSLSHGHGRSIRRRRFQNEDNGVPFFHSSTPSSTPGGGSSPSVIDVKLARNRMRSQSHDEVLQDYLGNTARETLEVNYTGEDPVSEESHKISSMPLDKVLVVNEDIPNMKHNFKEDTVAPPNELELSTETISPIQKYVPPQKRKYVPPHKRKEYIAPPIDTAELSEQVRSEEEEFFASNEDFYEFATDAPSIPAEMLDEVINIGLGGCADPSLITGSICDVEFIPEKASKVRQSADHPFGYRMEKSEIGAMSTCGVRDSNEDSYLILNDLLDGVSLDEEDSFFGSFEKRSLFAIFDGHCGNHAARYAAEKLHDILIEESKYIEPVLETEGADETRIKQLLDQSISRLDKEFCELCTADEREWYSGTTAIIALSLDQKLIVANVGDCSGVMCCSSTENIEGWEILEVDDSDSFREMNPDNSNVIWREVAITHSPSNEKEKIRIEAANGWTANSEQEVAIASQFQTIREHLGDEDVQLMFLRWFSDRSDSRHARILNIWRVCGDLAVSRAIGDREYKAAFGEGSYDSWKSTAPFPYPTNHSELFNGDLIISTPDISCYEVFGDENVLLLACDGLWDVLDADEAIRLTRKLIFERGLTARESVSFYFYSTHAQVFFNVIGDRFASIIDVSFSFLTV